MVECIPSQLNQVFMNLLVNAAQAIPEQGIVTIHTACDGDWVTIAVTDTGTGMAADLRSRIFDPFFTTKPVGQGTGLGLSVSYGIVDRHGGRIDVDSEPGAGSTFAVRLPVRRRPAPDQPQVAPQ
jgi:signal transduction histidine kinase